MLRRLAAVALAAALFALPPALSAESKVSIVIVYDASGSMWAKMDGKERFKVLNKALGTFLDRLPADTELALRVYGSRRKSDCADTQMLVPFGTNNRDTIRQALAKLRPLGKTPIQNSLLAAAEDLRGLEGQHVILLVSDGEETCSGDPCETARLLAEKEKIRIDVIGFAIDKDLTRRQLSCIAATGKGDYFDAGDERQADTGFDSVAAAVAPQPKQGTLTVRIERPKGVLAPTQGLHVEVHQMGQEAPAATFEGQSLAKLALPGGVYRVRASIGETEQSLENINLEAGGAQEAIVEFQALEGVVTVQATSGGASLGTRVICTAFPAGAHEGAPLAEQYSSLAMVLPEGSYDLRCRLLGAAVEAETWLTGAIVKANQSREIELKLPLGSLTVQAIGQPNVLGDHQIYQVYPAGDRNNLLAWSYCGAPSELPAGSYDVQVQVGDKAQPTTQWLEGIRVPESSAVEATADFRPGELLIQVSSGALQIGNDAKFTVYPPGLEHRKPLGWSYNGVPLQVPAGVYDILIEYQPTQETAQKQWLLGIPVQSGQQLVHQVEFATGSIQGHVLFGGQDLLREGSFSVYLPGEEDKPIGTFQNHEVASLPTGTYDVRAESSYLKHEEWRRNVGVLKDATTTVAVDFAAGKLILHVMQGGQDLGKNATYYVYPQNEKAKYVAFAFSGDALDVVPGIYDVKVTLGPTTQWKQGVFVEAGETTEDKIEF